MMAKQGNHRGPAGLTSRGGAASAKSGSADSRRAVEDDKSLARLKRALRKAERRAGDGSDIGGTGATILKLLPAPLARLLDKGRIGTEEVRAADDIAIAFHHYCQWRGPAKRWCVVGPNGTMVREGVLTKEEAERDVSTRNTPTSMAFVTHPRM
jgi:hypothetical protein